MAEFKMPIKEPLHTLFPCSLSTVVNPIVTVNLP